MGRARHAVEALMAQRDTEATRALVADEVAWAKAVIAAAKAAGFSSRQNLIRPPNGRPWGPYIS